MKRERKSLLSVRNVALVAFISLAAVASISIIATHHEFKNEVLAARTGSPLSWNDIPTAGALETNLSTRVDNETTLQYTITVKNTDPSHTFLLTHLASHLKTVNNKGFIPLSDETLEYTYTPSEAYSWSSLAISAPGGSRDNFRLDGELSLTKSGTPTDTVYLRYTVTPEDAVIGSEVNDVIYLLALDEDDQPLSTSSESTVALADTTVVATIDAETGEPLDDSNSDAFAQPLGVESYSSDSVKTISTTIADFEGGNKNLPLIGMILCGGIFVALIICLILHFSSKRKK